MYEEGRRGDDAREEKEEEEDKEDYDADDNVEDNKKKEEQGMEDWIMMIITLTKSRIRSPALCSVLIIRNTWRFVYYSFFLISFNSLQSQFV